MNEKSTKLRIGMQRRALVVDPVAATNIEMAQTVATAFQTLVRTSETFEPVPDLAVSWSISNDGREYRFHLNPVARFHDGTPVTAETAARSLARMLWPGTGSFVRSTLADVVEGAEHLVDGDVPAGLGAEGSSTLVIRLRAPYPPLLRILSHPALAVSGVGEDGRLTGSGPLVPTSLDEDGLRMEVYAGYVGSRPRRHGLQVRLFDTRRQVFDALAAGEIDATVGHIQKDIDRTFEGLPITRTALRHSARNAIFFNGAEPLAALPGLRRDVAALLCEFVDEAARGNPSLKPIRTLLPPTMLSAQYAERPRDRLTAEAFAARWRETLEGRPIRFLVQSGERMLPALREALRPLGVAIDIESRDDYDEYLVRIAAREYFAVGYTFVAGIADPDAYRVMLQRFDEPTGPFPMASFLDRWSESRFMPVAGDRLTAYTRALLAWELDHPVVPLFEMPVSILHRSDVGISADPHHPFDAEGGLAASLLQYQDDLRIAERNGAVAMAAQMLAHDMRKPLSLMSIGIGMMRRAKSGEDALAIVDKLAPELERAKARVEGLIADIMEIGQPDTLELVPTSPTELVETGVRDLLVGITPEAVVVTYDLRHLRKVKADPGKLGRVFSNIIGNALQAMRNQGRLWLVTAEAEGHVEFTIGNSGPVIPAEDLPRLFEAFFTKGKRHGTGLGLAIAHKLVRAHGGEIRCASSEAGGTVFRFTVPCDDELDDLQPGPLSSQRPAGDPGMKRMDPDIGT